MLMEQNTMLILFLSLFFHCGLPDCGEWVTDNINKPLRTDHEHKARRHDNIINYRNILTTPLYNETYPHDSAPPVLTPSSPLSNDSTVSTSPDGQTAPSQFDEDDIYPTSKTRPIGFEGTSIPPDVTAPYITIYPPGFVPTSVNLHTETTMNPSVAEYAKQWLEEVAFSTAVTPKLVVPKLGSIFDYDYAHSVHGCRRRNQKTVQRKISNRQLKSNALRHQMRPIVRRGVTLPQITMRRRLKELSLLRTKRTKTLTTVTKRRLEPGLLLGKATIGEDSNTDDDDGFEKITSGSDESKGILRMHVISKVTKKWWYSDQTTEQELRTATPTTNIQFVRHTFFPGPNTTTKKTTQSNLKMTDIHKETHMIVFLTELTRLIATKEKTAVHDVVKHADQIIRGLYRSGQLQWFPQPLINLTKKVAKQLKKSETNITQKHAADIHDMLRQRPQKLSEEVNTILERADRLYDDGDGKRLFEVLNEFAVYPNITLNGYWLCNSLINNFLRPYRRITDKRQRQKLIDSVNLALKARLESSDSKKTTRLASSESKKITRLESSESKKKTRSESSESKKTTRFASSESNETTTLQCSDFKQANVSSVETEIPTQKEHQIETTQSTRIRKRKRRHHKHKRARERTQFRLLNNTRSYVIY